MNLGAARSAASAAARRSLWDGIYFDQPVRRFSTYPVSQLTLFELHWPWAAAAEVVAA